MGPHREDLLPYQRLSHDFFMSNDLREELQKKSAATLQVLELKFGWSLCPVK
jgi:PAB-dependent poly(A)-specific ribonuclease subunit 3